MGVEDKWVVIVSKYEKGIERCPWNTAQRDNSTYGGYAAGGASCLETYSL